MASSQGDVDEAQENAGFKAGFETDAPPTETVKPEKTEPKDQPVPKTVAKEAVKPAPKETVKEEKPEYVQLTKADFESFRAAAAKTTSLEGQMAKAFGTVGNLKQLVDKIQAETPKGETVELPADIVAELETEFPELAGNMRKSFERLLKGLRGTAAAEKPKGETPATPDPEAFGKSVNDAVQERTLSLQRADLDDAHPDWKTIVGAIDVAKGEQPDPNNPYRKWLAAKPAEYQAKINEAESAGVIMRSIDLFKAETKPVTTTPQETKRDAAQRDRITGSIQPRGLGHEPKPQPTVEDAFREGFRSG